MIKLISIICIFFISGCAKMSKTIIQNEVIKTKTGVIFTMNTPGTMSYKGSDIEANIDTRTPSLLRTLVEGVVVQGMSNRNK